jgi:hypothetical protein
LINETKAKSGAKMSERNEVTDDELFDPRELLEVLDVYNISITFISVFIGRTYNLVKTSSDTLLKHFCVAFFCY